METTHTTAGGRVLVVSFSIQPLRDGQGRVVALLPEGRDISDLARERERLRLSEMRFRSLVEHAPEAIVDPWMPPPGASWRPTPRPRRCSRQTGRG
ncbi:MAG: hypothetical protein U0P46_02245 [Holophagaceae bacterium]